MDIQDLQQKYNLEFDKIIIEINSHKYKTVLLQFPDGLKQYATQVVDYLSKEVDCEFKIWLGSCFGACDVPKTDSELIIQFGHAPWGKKTFNEI